jgi:hypothetical protein
MFIASKTRLLVSAAILGICIFAASWTAVRRFGGENAERETIATTLHKLVYGELSRKCGRRRETIPPNRKIPTFLGPIRRGISL